MIKKYAAAEVSGPVISINDWQKIRPRDGKKIAAASAFTLPKAEMSRYLLTHATIMASVHCEDAPYDFLIRPESSIFVNSNLDCWENSVLSMSYHTFRGAFNFHEHFQNTKASKGHILDAILRKVHITPEVWVYYVDILVATDLAHESLVNDIKSEKTKFMSMGCVCNEIRCSFCGTFCTDQDTYCNHLLYEKGDFKMDENGVPRRVAELCGNASLPGGGVQFVEASWVSTPAFPGASRRNIIAEEWIGPKTQYTSKAANTKGLAKAASGHEKVHPKVEADLRRLLK